MALSIDEIAAAIQELGVKDEPLTRIETMQLLCNMAETLRAIKVSPAFLELTEHEEFFTDNDLFIGDAIQALDEILDGAKRADFIIGKDFYDWGGQACPDGVSPDFISGYNSARLEASN
ncbi:hypothetical protein [Microcoleus sp. bin38.metabat.b11b12b14.051]|uniref:hypothetical protein n=1 Tax=Microcoleus sp. bin38.metabat.b11b12b14.051 TaxID=2742709 RepID=UPI0025F7DA96|nr:hypothetical protein [Microcoleus sp. bin38.metabat.b11b12b14.051]